jgi:glutamyl-tRNA synthetase
MKDEIMAFALENALEHQGKSNVGPVMGKIMAVHPELKKDAKALSRQILEVLKEVNSMDMEQQKALLESMGGPPELAKRERKDPMVDLDGVENGHVIMRFAPGPSGPLHIGHTRAAILNDEYCRRYDGKFILRLEDTNPEKIDPEAYKMIPEDLDWLGVKVDKTYVQSDRFDEYYSTVRQLIEKGQAYVCTMEPEKWREMKANCLPCQERDLPVNIQMEKWDRMMEGSYDEGKASLVIKTDIDHRNPAVRDFVGMRIKHTPHPRTGDRYHLYPLYNLSVAIDDHLMGCTHILRGKDHLNNTIRQEYVYSHMEWDLPDFIHYGLVSIPETLLKTSLIREEIAQGNFSGWNDTRLGTVRALSERGFVPDAIRRYWLEVGVKPVDISFSWETLESMNREIIDENCPRYFFVQDPMRIRIRTHGNLKGSSPLFPGKGESGFRNYDLEPDNGIIDIFVSRQDEDLLKEDATIRLKDLCNLKLIGEREKEATLIDSPLSEIKKMGIPIIHWVSLESVECRIKKCNGEILAGLAEPLVRHAANEGLTVQFERFGYCKLRYNGSIIGEYTHS